MGPNSSSIAQFLTGQNIEKLEIENFNGENINRQYPRSGITIAVLLETIKGKIDRLLAPNLSISSPSKIMLYLIF